MLFIVLEIIVYAPFVHASAKPFRP